ncbi:MAG: hypothetical protein HZA77_05905 [Candidatus Schekmanbacteria bacterium]|nr:hypothetical protein [Candidatus Schekmanbacteria bacterium]
MRFLKNKSAFNLVVFVFLMLISSHVCAFESKQEVDAKKTLQEFCSSEFNGIRDARVFYVTFSPDQAARDDKINPPVGAVDKTWDWDPLVVVDSYKIKNIEVKGERAVVEVSYTRLANTESYGYNRKLIENYMENDVVKFQMVFKDGNWKVFDPPEPRISYEAIVNYYRNEVASMKDVIALPDASKAQKQWYQKLKK